MECAHVREHTQTWDIDQRIIMSWDWTEFVNVMGNVMCSSRSGCLQHIPLIMMCKIKECTFGKCDVLVKIRMPATHSTRCDVQNQGMREKCFVCHEQDVCNTFPEFCATHSLHLEKYSPWILHNTLTLFSTSIHSVIDTQILSESSYVASGLFWLTPCCAITLVHRLQTERVSLLCQLTPRTSLVMPLPVALTLPADAHNKSCDASSSRPCNTLSSSSGPRTAHIRNVGSVCRANPASRTPHFHTHSAHVKQIYAWRCAPAFAQVFWRAFWRDDYLWHQHLLLFVSHRKLRLRWPASFVVCLQYRRIWWATAIIVWGSHFVHFRLSWSRPT